MLLTEKLPQITDVLQRKFFEAMGAAVLEDNYGQIPFCYEKCM